MQALSRLTQEKKRKLWVLTDEPLHGRHWHDRNSGWFVVFAASPETVRACQGWHKNRRVSLYFMRNWPWPEIFAAYCLEAENPPSQDEINKLFTTYTCLGPVARTCLESIDVSDDNLYNETLQNYLREVDREIAKFVARGGRETVEHAVLVGSSHKMAIMDPTEGGFSYTARIITRWIGYRVYEKAQKHSQHGCFETFKCLSRHPALRTAAGWFFEGYVHDWLLRGGTFEADQMPVLDSTVATLQFHSTKSESGQPRYFTTGGNLSEQVQGLGGRGINPAVVHHYFLPYSRNYPSVDGLMFSDVETLLLFQITLAKKHEIKPLGVAQLLKCLPKTIMNIDFVFVVPEDRADDYSKAQRIPDSASVSPSGKKLNLRQFRLVFGEYCMAAVGIDGQVVEEGEGDEYDYEASD
jgi:hypothetical protein